jgi:hypothetical protein
MFQRILIVLLVVCVSVSFAQITKVTALPKVKPAVAAKADVKKVDAKINFKLVKVVPETTKVYECDSALVIKYDSVKVATMTRDTTLTKDTIAHAYAIDTVKTKAKVKK